MNNKNKIYMLLRKALFLITFIMAQTLCAQSNGDKLFLEGQTLQQTKTIAAQNKAIKKFQAAKIVYTSPEKKKMCDNQIAICNSNIAALRKPKSSKDKPQPEKTEEKKFSLSAMRVVADEKKGIYHVDVSAPTTEWTFSAENVENEQQEFVKAYRDKDGQSMIFEIEENSTTLTRTQNFIITCGDESKTLQVIQRGKNVVLKASTDLMEFKAKGGIKLIEIYTNSDSIVSDNRNLTWYVHAKPDWIEISFDSKKQKNVFSKIFSSSQERSDDLDEDVKSYSIAIVARTLAKTDPSYLTGRRGEIVFSSQDKTYKLIVLQQK